MLRPSLPQVLPLLYLSGYLRRRLQREIDLLQRKIAAVRRQVAAGQPGGAASAGEDALSAAVAAGDVWGADDRVGSSGRVRGTKTAIERDKALARLGLHAVEEFPRDVLVDIVQVSRGLRTALRAESSDDLCDTSGCCRMIPASFTASCWQYSVVQLLQLQSRW